MKVYKNAVGLALEQTVNEDLTGVSEVRLNYKKPNLQTGYFPATVTDYTSGKVEYQTTSPGDLDDCGVWSFWVTAHYSGGNIKIFEPVKIAIYEAGDKYLHYPYGTLNLNQEGDISMPTEAFRILYDNSVSNMTADDVQSALDELDNRLDTINAQQVSYNNTNSGLTSSNVQSAIDEAYTNFLNDKKYVVGPLPGEYSKISEAINKAVDDGATSNNPALILIKPGNYVETGDTLNLQPGIHLKAVIEGSSTFTGKVIVNFANDDDLGSITGLNIVGVNGENCIEFSGSNKQKFYLKNLQITSNTGVLSNLYVDNSEITSEIYANNVNFFSDTNANEATIKSSNCSITLKSCLVVSNDSVGSMQLTNAAQVTSKFSSIIGTIHVTDAAWIENYVNKLTSTNSQPVLTANGTGSPAIFYHVLIDSDATPVVTGSGAFAFSFVAYKNGSTGRGFESTLNSGAGAIYMDVDSATPAFKTGTSDPSYIPHRAGEPYYRTDTDELFIYNGTSWKKIALT